MNSIQFLWTEWHQLWIYQYFGMVMAILSSQELLNITLKLLSLTRQHFYTPRTWLALFLNLDFAFEYPIVFMSLPKIPQAPGRVVFSSTPGIHDLLFQISILILVENICLALMPDFEPSKGERSEYSPSAALAVEFITPRLTLLIGIPVLEILVSGSVLFGKLHFLGIVGWLLCRHFLAKRTRGNAIEVQV